MLVDKVNKLVCRTEMDALDLFIGQAPVLAQMSRKQMAELFGTIKRAGFWYPDLNDHLNRARLFGMGEMPKQVVHQHNLPARVWWNLPAADKVKIRKNFPFLLRTEQGNVEVKPLDADRATLERIFDFDNPARGHIAPSEQRL